MNQSKIMLFVVALMYLFLPACISNIKTVPVDSFLCTKDSLKPGETTVFMDTVYVCVSFVSTPTPVSNISTALLQTAKTLCQENNVSWQHPTNAKWLAENVVIPASSWQYQDGKWIYTNNPDSVYFSFGGGLVKSRSLASYPGFGTFTVHLSEGGTTKVDENNWYIMRGLWFTKLELSCP